LEISVGSNLEFLLNSIFGLIQQEAQKPLIALLYVVNKPLHMNSPNATLGFVGKRGEGHMRRKIMLIIQLRFWIGL
jgi:hypothetical protein